MKKFLSTLGILLLFICPAVNAQGFVDNGVIEYERSINMFALMQKQITKANEATMRPVVDNYRKTRPQFKVLKSTLSFSNNKTLFVPEEVPMDPNARPWANLVQGGVVLIDQGGNPGLEQHNTIYTDASAQTIVNQKTIYDEVFLVKDTARPIKWKITSEVRNVAGYKCRRANGLMLDSIYVVAFYSEDIPVSGGPESFNGLPGMILQVALPDEHVIWTATKVEAKTIPAPKAPTKGKTVNNKELQATLESNLKSRGIQMADLLKAFIL